MIVTLDMKLKKRPGEMWGRFLSDDLQGPLRDLVLLRAEYERAGIENALVVQISDAPFPDDMPGRPSLTAVVSYDKTLRRMTRYVRDENTAPPFMNIHVRTKWLEAVSAGDTLYVRIVAPYTVKDAETQQDDDVSDVTDIEEQRKNFARFLSHHVVEAPDAVLYTRDLWALWSSVNPGSVYEDAEIAGIKRVSARRFLLPIFPGFPASTVDRIGPETHRCWAGYTLRDEGAGPGLPRGVLLPMRCGLEPLLATEMMKTASELEDVCAYPVRTCVLPSVLTGVTMKGPLPKGGDMPSLKEMADAGMTIYEMENAQLEAYDDPGDDDTYTCGLCRRPTFRPSGLCATCEYDVDVKLANGDFDTTDIKCPDCGYEYSVYVNDPDSYCLICEHTIDAEPD